MTSAPPHPPPLPLPLFPAPSMGNKDAATAAQYQMRVRVGQGEVIAGLDAVLPTLSQGQIAELVIPPLYAYGGATTASVPPQQQQTQQHTPSMNVQAAPIPMQPSVSPNQGWIPPPNTVLLVHVEMLQVRI
jgi:hypothetical protein